MDAEWQNQVSVNFGIIGPVNRLSPLRRQTIILTNPGLSFTGRLWTNVSKITKIVIQQNEFENVVGKIAPIILVLLR